ncbi:peptidoglycan-binding protein [Stella sp.]|uniref:peptidoglycan-binding protein n=1 Tax=Stella sp. TaxID=2912054 RepID=UPI0035B39DFD
MTVGGETASGAAAGLLQRLDPATRALVEAAAGTMRLTPADWIDLRVIQGSPRPLPIAAEAPPAVPSRPTAPAQPETAPVRAERLPLRPARRGSVLDRMRRGSGAAAVQVRAVADRFAPRLAGVGRRIAGHPLVHHRRLSRRALLAGAAGIAVLLLGSVWLMSPGDDAPAASPAGSAPPARVAGVAAPAVGTSGSPVPGSVPDSAAALAAATFREKAEKGDAAAQHDLGVLYADGRGVPRDYALAARWFRRSADSGMANAQFNLAVLTERGLGVPADPAEAARLYRQAALQGHAGAQYNLGIALAEGRGIAQDYAEAASWFRRAADQGFAKAAYNLGVLHERGLAGKVDDVEAYRWYARALEAGDGDAKERMEQIARRLPPQDLNFARQRPSGSADPALVSDIQRLLTARGYKPGVADGSFGERTADAIRRFQRDIGVPEDGQPTAELLRRLEGAPVSQ